MRDRLLDEEVAAARGRGERRRQMLIGAVADDHCIVPVRQSRFKRIKHANTEFRCELRTERGALTAGGHLDAEVEQVSDVTLPDGAGSDDQHSSGSHRGLRQATARSLSAECHKYD